MPALLLLSKRIQWCTHVIYKHNHLLTHLHNLKVVQQTTLSANTSVKALNKPPDGQTPKSESSFSSVEKKIEKLFILPPM